MTSRSNICFFALAAGLAVACSADEGGVRSIAEVQGAGATSPFVGRAVTVEGVVTGDFQDGDADRQNNLGGFFIQSIEPDGDADTSDGLFVYDSRTEVRVGDVVRVEGEVAEFFGETQLQPGTVTIFGEAKPEPVRLDLPTARAIRNSDGVLIGDLEAYEGMLVQLPQTQTVVDTFGLERAGTVLLHTSGRARQFTSDNRPDRRRYAEHRETFARSTLLLDDGRRDASVTPVRYLFPYSGRSRAVGIGDRVSGPTGVIRYSRDSGDQGTETYRLVPVEPPEFVASGRDFRLPRAADDAVRVMSFNTLNFFPTIDAQGATCGPNAQGCRGADSRAEFDRQRAKLITTLAQADADVIGLMEIENDARRSLEQLANGLGEVSGAPWRYIDTGVIGGDAIKVGLLYNSATVRPDGAHAILDATVDSNFVDNKNRPVLAQTFTPASGGDRFTVAVNHLKSKGSDCDELGDPNTGDGQGNCNRTRTRAAQAEIRWLAGNPTGVDTDHVLVIGDLNAYRMEDPVRAFTDAGYVNLVDRFVDEPSYSFVFRGESGSLDHALGSPALTERVQYVADWHINADEPRLLDYNLDGDRDAGYFDSATPLRASDHDPVIIDLRLD